MVELTLDIATTPKYTSISVFLLGSLAHSLYAVPVGLPGVLGIVKDGRDGSVGDPGEPGEAGRTGRTGHAGSPGICDTAVCQGASVAGKSTNPKNH